jgi:hypothetical protein
MSSYSSLSPFQDIIRDAWRVPVKVTDQGSGNEYKLFIDSGRANYYTNDTLPDFFKQSLAMIAARGHDGWVSAEGIDFENSAHVNTALLFYPPKHLEHWPSPDLGWRVNKNYYCVVTPASIMVSLRGEPIVKESKSDDTRGESKSEGKEGTE